MHFEPRVQVTPRMLRQLKAIEQTTGFLEAVRLRQDWIANVRAQSNVKEALSSLQIEGNSLTLEEAFALAQETPARELRNSEREFCNYLRAFDAIDSLRGERDAVLTKGDLLNVHHLHRRKMSSISSRGTTPSPINPAPKYLASSKIVKPRTELAAAVTLVTM